ncbi:MAG TPA: ATP-binding cassette domain-containing protein [Desulfopila sp.]|nr:ATP-binding cassette domain-containing protein [Desulfopila sp.]
MKDSAIEFKNVVKSFDRSDGGIQKVLDAVNFLIPAGKTTVIAGGSGQGKSVTLKLILGLMDPDQGEILVDGEDIVGLGSSALKRHRSRFGVLFQGSALFDSMTVYDNIALPLRERTDLSEEDIGQKIHQTLEQLELDGAEKRYPAQLSGGMRKRVGLARALQLDPEIMLFDEPTTGLDPVMTQDIYQLFAATQQRVGFTSVIVSHDIPRVLNLADQVIILQGGKTDVFDSPEEIQLSEKEHIKEFVKTTMGQIYQSRLVEI